MGQATMLSCSITFSNPEMALHWQHGHYGHQVWIKIFVFPIKRQMKLWTLTYVAPACPFGGSCALGAWYVLFNIHWFVRIVAILSSVYFYHNISQHINTIASIAIWVGLLAFGIDPKAGPLSLHTSSGQGLDLGNSAVGNGQKKANEQNPWWYRMYRQVTSIDFEVSAESLWLHFMAKTRS